MFANKTIFITGASSGLGRALAVKLSYCHVNLALMARSLERLEQTKFLCNPDANVELIYGDVSDDDHCKMAIKHAVDTFGQLDYLILNAGVSMWSRFDAISDISSMAKLIETNYLGAVYCVHHALPMIKTNHGMIVGISSIQGRIPVPYHSGYVASKHALQGFLNTIRMELRGQASVLTVSPGWIDGTNIRENAFNENIKMDHKKTKNRKNSAIPLDICVNKIIKAMKDKKQDLVLPRMYQMLSALQLLAPKLLSRLLMRRL
jgi:short-subunit dehydrogenase